MSVSDEQSDDVITVEQVAKLLGIGVHAVYNAANRGQLPHRRVGRRLLFSRAAILAWLQTDERS